MIEQLVGELEALRRRIEALEALEAAMVDAVSGATVTIDFAHHEVHEGDHYIYSNLFTIATSGNTKLWRLVTPNTTKRCHMVIGMTVNGETEVRVYENPTTTGNGNQRTPINSERDSANAATLTVWEDPTFSGAGTLLEIGLAGAGNKTGGEERGNIELVLKTNEEYHLEFTARTNNDKILMRLEWYEHVPSS